MEPRLPVMCHSHRSFTFYLFFFTFSLAEMALCAINPLKCVAGVHSGFFTVVGSSFTTFSVKCKVVYLFISMYQQWWSGDFVKLKSY